MRKKVADISYNLFLLVFGSALWAFSVKAILVPQEFVARGITGISLLVFYKFDAIPLAVIYFLLNIPIFALGLKFVGKRFTLYSLAGMLIYTAILAFVPFELKLGDKMLAAFTAGALSGAGLAVIMRSYGTVGGADILYVIINKLAAVPIGTSAFVINAVIILVMAFMFPPENVLYTLVYLVVSSVVANKAFHGLASRRSLMIVSEKWQEISADLKKQRIGVTIIEGKGGYKGENRTILYSVINRKNIMTVKKIVLKADPNAFMAIMRAEDVTGLDVGNQPHW